MNVLGDERLGDECRTIISFNSLIWQISYQYLSKFLQMSCLRRRHNVENDLPKFLSTLETIFNKYTMSIWWIFEETNYFSEEVFKTTQCWEHLTWISFNSLTWQIFDKHLTNIWSIYLTNIWKIEKLMSLKRFLRRHNVENPWPEPLSTL